MTPTHPPRPLGRARLPRVPCQCGSAWEVHRPNRAGKPCMRCACTRYTAVLPPPAPELLVVEPSLAERVACAPELHVGSRNCPACAAWEAGRVLLTNGQQCLRQRWVQAYEAKRTFEEE